MILALLAMGLPCCILAAFLFECWQHHRELEKAESDMGAPPPGSDTETTGRNRQAPK